jgi:hypothetical protein
LIPIQAPSVVTTMLRKHLSLALVTGLALALAAPAAHARKKPRPAAKPAAQKAQPAQEKSAASSEPAAAAAPAPTPAPTQAAGSAKPRVYTFSGLDVNGNLKAPQLLFFRGRVKQELDTSNPEKRSFLKELERTADAKGL